MADLNEAKGVVASYWSKAWTWVADHPKTTIVIAGAAIVALLVVR